MKNLIKGENTITATKTISLDDSGLNTTNCESVRTVAGSAKTWKPKSKLNSLVELEGGKDYIIIAKKNCEVKGL